MPLQRMHPFPHRIVRCFIFHFILLDKHFLARDCCECDFFEDPIISVFPYTPHHDYNYFDRPGFVTV